MKLRWLSVGALICCQWASAQQATPGKPADPLEEVEVNAPRERLSAMRRELVKLTELDDHLLADVVLARRRLELLNHFIESEGSFREGCPGREGRAAHVQNLAAFSELPGQVIDCL